MDFHDLSTTGRAVKHVKLEELKRNPLNILLYDSSLNVGLKASVEEFGVLVPIRVTEDGTIVDGHQRYAAAEAGGYKSIPTLTVDIKPEYHMQAMLSFNRGRICTNTEMLREFREFLNIESLEARERSGRRTDLVQLSAPGEAKFGKSRDFAAEKVGLSGYYAGIGLQVLECIEKLEAEGKFEQTKDVRKILNESIKRAYKMAISLGWLDPAVKPKPEGTNEGILDSPPEGRGQLEIIGGWITEDVIEAVLCYSQVAKSGQQPIKEAILSIRPAIIALTGPKPTKSGANKLRCLAGVLIDMASRMASTQPK